uniref:Uncharacterized protein n=1 Tax=Setaria italica TaxID=4555 RepID=K3YBL6_SETIT
MDTARNSGVAPVADWRRGTASAMTPPKPQPPAAERWCCQVAGRRHFLIERLLPPR